MTRNEKKLNNLFWFLIMLLPIFIYFITCLKGEFIAFELFINNYSFSFITDILNDIFSNTFVFNGVLIAYISYAFSVELIHLFYDFMVFIIRLAHKWIGGIFND